MSTRNDRCASIQNRYEGDTCVSESFCIDMTSHVRNALREFFKTTTLHGFKYFVSSHQLDILCWLVCCAASACCAGVLCAVLWERFLETPTLLILDDVHTATHPMPMIAVCVPAEAIAKMFLLKLNKNSTSDHLFKTLTIFLQRKPAPEEKLYELERLFLDNNVVFPDALFALTPSCEQLNGNCRWHNKLIPCNKLFSTDMTPRGVCCVLQLESLNNYNDLLSGQAHSAFQLTLTLNCADDSALFGCEFFTKYDGEDWVEPIFLEPGKTYMALVSYSYMDDQDTEKVVDWTCVTENGYSPRQCVDKCAEYSCGCSDPLRARLTTDPEVLPPCSIANLNCLRTTQKFKNITCQCLPSCKQLKSKCNIGSNRLKSGEYTIDPIFNNLNSTLSLVVEIRISVTDSQILLRHPTETWFTLLSSLGGVFSMFLGVSLFSALEVLFFILIKLPVAAKRSSEISHIIT